MSKRNRVPAHERLARKRAEARKRLKGRAAGKGSGRKPRPLAESRHLKLARAAMQASRKASGKAARLLRARAIEHARAAGFIAAHRLGSYTITSGTTVGGSYKRYPKRVKGRAPTTI